MRKQLFFASACIAWNCRIIAQTVLGIDVSSYQGLVNWTQVKGAGYMFAWAKATEGLTITDSQYSNNAVNGPAAGMYMGAYHFAHPDVNSTNSGAVSEANHFLSVAQPYIISCELPPVLDLEVSTSLTSAQLTVWVQTWMNTVQSATGIVPILYTDGSIANSLQPSIASYCKLWIADPDGSPTAAPSSTYLGVWYPNWSFKQYSWTGTVPGISGQVDMDSFNGSLASLKTLMGCTPPVCHHYYATLPYVTSFEQQWITDSCNNGAQRLPDMYWKSSIGGTTPNGNDYWHRNDYTGGDWTTVTNGTYTPAASAGNYSARFHNDPPPAGSQGLLDLYINLSPAGTKQVKFDYIHNESSVSPFSFNVLLSTDSGHTFPTTLYSITTAQISNWTTQSFTTNATSATSVLRFVCTDKGTHDVGIDNLSVKLINDTTPPTTLVSVSNAWETQNFTASFTDADNTGGSGLEKSYYQAIYYDGTQWGANYTHGFFADDFNTSISPNWTTKTGTWSINSAALYQSDTTLSNTNIYAPLTQNLSNRYLYYFTAKIGGAGTNRRAGFHFFCDQPDSSNRNNSYFVWFRVDQSVLQIYKVVNNVFGSPVYTVTATFNPNQFYDYIVVYDRISGLMRVYQDNVLIGSWTDPSPYSNGGYISFRTGNATLSVDQLRVYRSRAASVNVSLGSGNVYDLEYQNTNPTTPAAHINSICNDNVGNLSAFVSKPVNIDWTKPVGLNAVTNGTGGAPVDSVCFGTTQLSANWSTVTDPNSGLSYYEYAIGTSPGAQNIVPWTNNGTVTSVTKTGLSLSTGQHYYFTVKAVDGAGLVCDSVNGAGVLVISCTTGLTANASPYQLLIYPNPSKGDFIIKAGGSPKSFSASVYNNIGQYIMQQDAVHGENEIHVSDLGKGIYYVTVFLDGVKVATQKMIVIE